MQDRKMQDWKIRDKEMGAEKCWIWRMKDHDVSEK